MSLSINPLFASYGNLDEAHAAAELSLSKIPAEFQPFARTAYSGILNTALKLLESPSGVSLSDLAAIRPRDLDSPLLSHHARIADISQEEAAQIIRDTLPSMIQSSYELAQRMPNLGSFFTTYLLLIGNLYALSPETIVEEVRQLNQG